MLLLIDHVAKHRLSEEASLWDIMMAQFAADVNLTSDFARMGIPWRRQRGIVEARPVPQRKVSASNPRGPSAECFKGGR